MRWGLIDYPIACHTDSDNFINIFMKLEGQNFACEIQYQWALIQTASGFISMSIVYYAQNELNIWLNDMTDVT